MRAHKTPLLSGLLDLEQYVCETLRRISDAYNEDNTDKIMILVNGKIVMVTMIIVRILTIMIMTITITAVATLMITVKVIMIKRILVMLIMRVISMI